MPSIPTMKEIKSELRALGVAFPHGAKKAAGATPRQQEGSPHKSAVPRVRLPLKKLRGPEGTAVKVMPI